MIGLDSSAIIDIFKGDKKIKQFLDKNREPLAATIISYLELSFGLDPNNPKHMKEGRYYDEFFRELFNINLTKNACKEASKIFWNLKKKGKSIEQFDCIISALFLVNGINKIITRNKKHFEKIKGLKVIGY